jgi:hypothetical protein
MQLVFKSRTIDTGSPLIRCYSQTMDLVDLAIHEVVYQKSDFHGNSDIQNFQKLDPFEITAKKFQTKIC